MGCSLEMESVVLDSNAIFSDQQEFSEPSVTFNNVTFQNSISINTLCLFTSSIVLVSNIEIANCSSQFIEASNSQILLEYISLPQINNSTYLITVYGNSELEVQFCTLESVVFQLQGNTHATFSDNILLETLLTNRSRLYISVYPKLCCTTT